MANGPFTNLCQASQAGIGRNDAMKAKVLIHVDREAALEAIRTLDALGEALLEAEHDWPKKLKRKYRHARRDLVHAIGYAALFAGVSDRPVIAD
jgi:hypothetical protein